MCRFKSGLPHHYWGIDVRNMADIITERVPEGWSWTLYSESSSYKARAVIVSPDFRIQIGREGKTIDEALNAAARAARNGERQ